MVTWRIPEIALGSLLASVIWVGLLGWQAAYAPTEQEKQECYEAAKKSGHKTEECKTLWERTTSDPVALFTLGIFIFTAILGVSTIFLWRATRDAAIAGKTAAEHIPRVERAYIYGGFGPQGDGRRYKIDEDLREYIATAVTMANYGKTPGFVKTISVGNCKLSELPDDPVYRDEFVISDLYFPGMTMADVRRTLAETIIPASGDYVVFQRVFYTDVLGKEHYSGSIYRLFAVSLTDGIHIFAEPVKPDSAYWATDDDEPKK